MNELDLAIFDLAGTTVKDEGQVEAAFTATLSEYGLVVTPEQIKSVRGASKRQALLNLFPAGPDRLRLAEEAYTWFNRRLSQLFTTQGMQAIPGAETVFQWLRARGTKVGINTGFDQSITEMLLKSLGWADGMVDAVVCGDEVSQGRPAPYLIFHVMETTGIWDVHRVAVFGDTALDLQAGYHAGVRWNVGVLSGAHDRQTLERAPHTHLLASVAEIPHLFQ